jgi:hypothetical protein
LLAAAIAEPSQRPATKKYVKPEVAIRVFELLMMGGVSPETCLTIKKHWNNKLYYTLASCWFFLCVFVFIVNKVIFIVNNIIFIVNNLIFIVNNMIFSITLIVQR